MLLYRRALYNYGRMIPVEIYAKGGRQAQKRHLPPLHVERKAPKSQRKCYENPPPSDEKPPPHKKKYTWRFFPRKMRYERLLSYTI